MLKFEYGGQVNHLVSWSASIMPTSYIRLRETQKKRRRKNKKGMTKIKAKKPKNSQTRSEKKKKTTLRKE